MFYIKLQINIFIRVFTRFRSIEKEISNKRFIDDSIPNMISLYPPRIKAQKGQTIKITQRSRSSDFDLFITNQPH